MPTVHKPAKVTDILGQTKPESTITTRPQKVELHSPEYEERETIARQIRGALFLKAWSQIGRSGCDVAMSLR